MKKLVSIVLVLLSIAALAGCSDSSSPSAGSDTLDAPGDTITSVVDEDKSVQIIRSMMELDYPSMTVTAFNEAILMLCTNADTTVFEVISDAYEHFSVYDESGEFISIMFKDRDLESFMQTTLSYSAAEIFGEPVHMGSVTYMTMPDMTATELSQKRMQMQPDEWERFYEQNIADISIFPVLSYEIKADIPEPGTLLVSERDDKLDDIHTSIQAFLLGLDAERASAEALEDDVLAEFERLSAIYSDDKMAVECQIQSIERDI